MAIALQSLLTLSMYSILVRQPPCSLSHRLLAASVQVTTTVACLPDKAILQCSPELSA